MIERNPERAAADVYDLLIVGGGIYGVAMALQSVRQGLRPLLLERGDFGGETSWNSLRIVHGGLRYLQTLDLPRFRESVAERRWFLRHFPDLVEPLPCLMPLYREGIRRPFIFRAALFVNDVLSATRNRGVRSDRRIPRGRILSVDETIERFPGVDRHDLTGGALWYDGAMPDSQRLLIEMLKWAVGSGAVALNYVEAVALQQEGSVVAGVQARDAVSGESLQFRAPVVVNCAGPWCRELASRFDRDVPDLFNRSVGFNLLFDRPSPSDAALAVTPRGGGRTYFLHPWKGRILAGTYHVAGSPITDDGKLEEAQVERFVADLNHAMPGFAFNVADVLRVHWGFLPAKRPGTPDLAVREVLYDHGEHGGPGGLFSVSGVKYTTARKVAEKMVARIRSWRGLSASTQAEPSRPSPTPWLPLTQLETALRDDPTTAGACVRRLIDQEAVTSLDDLILRRTDWGTDPRRRDTIAADILKLLDGDARLVGAQRATERGLASAANSSRVSQRRGEGE